MNPKTTWLLLALAALLAGFIYGWEKFVAGPARQPLIIVAGLDPATVRSVQVRITGQPEVLAERTNGGWHLTKPLPYAARPDSIETLLQLLAHLKPEATLSPRELMNYPNAEEEFGFDAPQATVLLHTSQGRRQLLIGSHTAPGDQVFVEMIGTPGVHLVSTNLLAALPNTPGDWRETALLDWPALKFDRLLVNNGARTMELQQNLTNKLWRLVRLQARADNALANQMLADLQQVQIAEFITDDPQADVDAYGLETPELEMIFASNSNILATLQFGLGPTNGTNLIYGRRAGSDTVFTVPSDALLPWRAAPTEFRDRHLVALTSIPESIEVRGDDEFRLVRQTNNLWRVLPQNFIADTNYMKELIVALAQMQVAEFVKDVVTAPDLPTYGLAPPACEYTLNFGGTYAHQVTLLFGTNRDDIVYTKRTDEASVSAVRRVDYEFLPRAGLELRNRRVWQFSEDDVARVIVEQDGHKRELLRGGTNSWTLAEGSFGAINTFGVEEAVHRVCDFSAAFWVARGPVDAATYGFKEPANRLTLGLKNGTKHEVEFGGEAPSQYPYARVTLDGEPWVMEFPWATWQFIQTYLSIPVREL